MQPLLLCESSSRPKSLPGLVTLGNKGTSTTLKNTHPIARPQLRSHEADGSTQSKRDRQERSAGRQQPRAWAPCWRRHTPDDSSRLAPKQRGIAHNDKLIGARC